MSLVRRKKKASETVVDSVVTKTVEIPQEPSQPAPEMPEPLGAHNSPGNREARAAFLHDEGGAPPVSEDAPKEKDTAQSDGATSGMPELSIEQIAVVATAAIDMTGQLVGNKLLKRPDVEWALEDNEKGSMTEALVPVLKESLQDTKVTPLHALAVVILTAYGARVGMMVMTKNPNAPEQTPAPEPTPAPVVIQPSPVAPERVVNVAPPKPANGNHGW